MHINPNHQDTDNTTHLFYKGFIRNGHIMLPNVGLTGHWLDCCFKLHSDNNVLILMYGWEKQCYVSSVWSADLKFTVRDRHSHVWYSFHSSFSFSFIHLLLIQIPECWTAWIQVLIVKNTWFASVTIVNIQVEWFLHVPVQYQHVGWSMLSSASVTIPDPSVPYKSFIK